MPNWVIRGKRLYRSTKHGSVISATRRDARQAWSPVSQQTLRYFAVPWMQHVDWILDCFFPVQVFRYRAAASQPTQSHCALDPSRPLAGRRSLYILSDNLIISTVPILDSRTQIVVLHHSVNSVPHALASAPEAARVVSRVLLASDNSDETCRRHVTPPSEQLDLIIQI
ncbi:hypothetical protein JAAARDRAFT_28222 [Jaapia argillacea MUCL 33604]|uniref:Uncharacterized protein n=1 Tax=Jaapia argillacea MUCL 33604 TaxID=933084 RepID=A0A067QPL6_9AGAM|nr:hypothetical protein JAAARDRAFT_28222 [Jaapia argillacea MUCL 33604]